MDAIFEKMLGYLTKIKELENDKERSSEQNLITHVIRPIFCEVLGYKLDWWISESPFDESRKAVDIKIRDNKGTCLLVEVKKSMHKLENNDFEQLANYLYNNDNEYQWGVLTNGRRWVLLNNQIKTKKNFTERKVFDLELDKKHRGEQDLEYLTYFQYDNLLKNKQDSITTYYRDLQQYKVLFSKGSWGQYRIGVQKFFHYLIETKERYIDLQGIRKHDLQGYFRWMATTLSRSQRSINKTEQTLKMKTIETQFRYLSSFYKTMFAANNPLINIKLEDILEEVQDLIITEESAPLDEFDSKKIESVYEVIKGREALRDRLIFDLFLVGLDRKEIAALPASPLSGKKIKLTDGREIELPEKIIEQINAYIQFKKDNKLKLNKLFCSSVAKPLKPQYVSEVINGYIKEIDPLLTIEKIQQYLFKQYLLKTKDVFTLLHITGFTLSRIQGILTQEEMYQLARKDKTIYNKHPFSEYIQ